MRSAYAHQYQGLDQPAWVSQEFVKHATKATNVHEIGAALLIEVRNLSNDRKYFEAIAATEKILLEHPTHLGAHYELRQLVLTASSYLDDLTRRDPAHPQAIQLYKKLKLHGALSLEAHFAAAVAYTLGEDYTAAKMILQQLLIAAPNYPGLNDLQNELQAKEIA